MKYLVQVIAYAAFAAIVGLLSAWPRFELLAPNQAVISLTFSHAGQRIGACRQLTQEELDELPPNMRKPSDCPRERHPISVEFRDNGTALYRATVPPSGIWGDGKSTVYRRLKIDAGMHQVFIGMRDSGREDGFDHELQFAHRLSPGQNLVIDFDEIQQGFVVR